MGSSLAFNCDTLHDGLIRRSAHSRGGASSSDVVDGTVTRRGMSGAVWRLICLYVLSWGGEGGLWLVECGGLSVVVFFDGWSSCSLEGCEYEYWMS